MPCRILNSICFTIITVLEAFLLVVFVAAMQFILALICAIIHSAKKNSDDGEACLDDMRNFTMILFIIGAVHVMLNIVSTVILWRWSSSPPEVYLQTSKENSVPEQVVQGLPVEDIQPAPGPKGDISENEPRGIQ